MRILRAVLFRLPAVLIAGTLWFLSSQSTLPQPPGVLLGWDKMQHLLAYGVLGAAIGLWVPLGFWKRRPWRAVLLTTAIGSIYGAIDEIHQYFVPYRDSNVFDWVANTLGSFLGALVIMLVMRKYRQAEQNTSKLEQQ